MFSNYVRTSLRIIYKNKIFSSINIVGFAFGMTAFFLISLYIWNERSYEDFHIKKNQLYRVRHVWYTNGEVNMQSANSPAAIGPDLKANFPEVLRYVRLCKREALLAKGDIFFKEDRIFYASEDFFKIFSYTLVKGIDSLVLKRPFTMVISESLAKKFFGNEDPIGKTLRNKGRANYEITGVFKDVPENSHLKFDALFSFASYIKLISPEEVKNLEYWWQDNFYTYVELEANSNVTNLESKLPAFVDTKVGKELEGENYSMAFDLQPISSIHLHSSFQGELEPNGDGDTNDFLALIAAFILGMAWINYINLSTARSLERAREVGMRKVLGSKRGQLVGQFLIESFFIKTLGLLISILLVALLLPSYSTFVGRRFDLSIFGSLQVWVFTVGIFLLGVVCAGLYPAVVVSGFKPISILKGKFQSSTKGSYFRKGLVVIQFVSSIVLITGTLVVYRQVEFMRNSSLGVNIEQILAVHGPILRDSSYFNRFKGFREGLLEYPEIKSVTASASIPGRAPTVSNGNIRLVNQDSKSGNFYRIVVTDDNFKDVFGLQLLAGRNFSSEFDDQGKSVMLNETAMRLLGFTDPEKVLGEKILVWDTPHTIIGILKDYHQESLKENVDQLVFVWNQEVGIYYSIKLNNGKSVREIISRVEAKYKKSFPGNPFRHFFVDDYYNQQYQSDQQFGKVFGLFALIAVIIACLGLFGLSSYIVVQRTKEIGIRKVLGASAKEIALLVSVEFIVLVLIASVIAWPISHMLMNNWLNDFAYRVNLGIVSFLLPGAIAIFIAILIVASQSIKVAWTNPTDSLRAE